VSRVQRRTAQGPPPAQRLEHKVERQCYEHTQRHDLEGKSSDHYVIARRGTPVGVRFGACKAATTSLQKEGDDITRDEDARVGERFNARILGAEGDDDSRQGEIDAGRHEGWSNRKAADLHEESILIKRIVVAYNSSNVANHLYYAATDHGNGEADEALRQRSLEDEAY